MKKEKVLIFSICILLIIVGVLSFVVYKLNGKNTNSELNDSYTFYAKIESINEYNGVTSLLIEGNEANDINYRGAFSCSLKDNTQLLWRGTKISKMQLKEGQNIAITAGNEVLESYPAILTNVSKVVVLEDEV